MFHQALPICKKRSNQKLKQNRLILANQNQPIHSKKVSPNSGFQNILKLNLKNWKEFLYSRKVQNPASLLISPYVERRNKSQNLSSKSIKTYNPDLPFTNIGIKSKT